MAKRKAPLQLLSPKNDFVFKQIFGDAKNTRPLESFLQATLELPAEEFQELSIIDPNMNPEHESDKLSILDVHVKMRSGKEVDIEIQTQVMPDMCNRLQYYTAKMLANQIQSGEKYSALSQVITIAIVDFTLWPDRKRYHHRFCMHEPEAEILYPDSMEIHTLELPKIPRDYDGSKLCDWLRFISSRTKKEFEFLAGKDTAMAEAYSRLMVLSQDEKERLRALAHEKFVRDHASRMQGAREEGLAEGLAKGEARAMQKIARQMLLRHTPVEEIAAITGLPEAEITRLSKRRATVRSEKKSRKK